MLTQIVKAITDFFEKVNAFLAKLDIFANWDQIFGGLKQDPVPEE